MPNLTFLLGTFVAGLASFFAPCSVPLLPAYLSIVGGVGAAVEREGVPDLERSRGRLLLGSVLYVLGFAIVFVILGVGAGSLHAAIRTAERPIEIVGGVLMVGFGLLIAGVFTPRLLARNIRLEIPQSWRRGGPLLALPIGMIFAVGWTPCVGPYLAGALTLAAASGHALSGGILLLAFALGLGLPFIAVALLWAGMPRLPRMAARLARPVTLVGGLTTVLLGLLLLSGEYPVLTSALARLSTPR